MNFSLENAIVYDIETYPNCFTFAMEQLYGDQKAVWEISSYRDDSRSLLEFFTWLHYNQVPMIGFNNVHFDYPVIHEFFADASCGYAHLYDKAQAIISSNDRFAHTVWERERFVPQIDLFKIHHFDNRAKTTSLKALEINMRADQVVDLPFKPGIYLTADDINNILIPYNRDHDVKNTKDFAHYSMKAIEFRLGLLDQFGLDALNFNDTKIGSKLLEQRLGLSNRTVTTPRSRIALNDIIFPYIQFQHPEFQRVLNYMRAQVLTPEDIDDPDAPIKTKGAFAGLKAHVGGIEFKFGTGGIHGSIEKQRIYADDKRIIRDIDVASLYPNIGIVNRLAPAHLGEAFVTEYSKLPAERKEWQAKKGKKCVEANSLKLASNGTYGNTNNKFSPFYDPQYTMTITINGQLMLCMLAEWLINVPTLQIIQINTDGITYRIDKDFEPQAAALCKQWEALTCLTLESADYSRMFIRDVNNYIAESPDGKLKQKGAYWHPDPTDYANSISEAQPPAWHKDLSAIIVIKAAVAAMVHGVDPEHFIRAHSDKFDFCCRVKADRSSKLLLGGQQIQNTTRYYVARNGAPMVKVSPPAGPLGAFKRRNGVSEYDYNRIMTETGGAWDERVCTKNKSKYETRETAIEAGWQIAECNDIRNFRFDNLNYDWYIAEARKLII